MAVLAVFTIDAVFTKQDSSLSNIYKVAFTACPCFLGDNLFKN